MASQSCVNLRLNKLAASLLGLWASIRVREAGCQHDNLTATISLGRQSDAVGERIDDSVGSGFGAGGILARDDLRGPDGEAVPVADAAKVDTVHLDIDDNAYQKVVWQALPWLLVP